MYCPYCGHKIPDDNIYCSECGRKIDPAFRPKNNDNQTMNQPRSTVTEVQTKSNVSVAPPVVNQGKNIPKNKKKKEENVIIPDWELTSDEMDVLNIRMSYFMAGYGSKGMAVLVGTSFAAAMTDTYGWTRRVNRNFSERDYQKQYEDERNRLKRIIVANRNKPNKITYQSLGYKKICNETYLPLRGDLQIEKNRGNLLDILKECYVILDNSDAIQAMAIDPMQRSAGLYMRRYKFSENPVVRVIAIIALLLIPWIIVTILMGGILAPIMGTVNDLTVIIAMIAAVPIVSVFGKMIWNRWNKPLIAERQEMQNLDTQAVEYIQASYQYLNDNFGIFYTLQSKYWNKDSIAFLYDAISNRRECGTWGQALNSLDAYLSRAEIQRKQNYQTAIMEKTFRETQRAADAAADAAMAASYAARRN